MHAAVWQLSSTEIGMLVHIRSLLTAGRKNLWQPKVPNGLVFADNAETTCLNTYFVKVLNRISSDYIHHSINVISEELHNSARVSNLGWATKEGGGIVRGWQCAIDFRSGVIFVRFHTINNHLKLGLVWNNVFYIRYSFKPAPGSIKC